MASRLGSVVSEASSTLATPSVSSSPMLKIPRWWESIKLPKPMMVESVEKTTARPTTLRLRGAPLYGASLSKRLLGL
jgi:hypothetical protein